MVVVLPVLKTGHKATPSPSLAQTVPAPPRIHDRQLGSLDDAQKILIASDEELGTCCQRCGRRPSVIRLAVAGHQRG